MGVESVGEGGRWDTRRRVFRKMDPPPPHFFFGVCDPLLSAREMVFVCPEVSARMGAMS